MDKAPIAVAAVLLALAATATGRAEPGRVGATDWVTLAAVGVAVEAPAAFVSAVEPPIVFTDERGAEIARYPSGTDGVRLALAAVDEAVGSPYAVAAALHDPADAPDITYRVDKPGLGVVSGYDGALIFYSGCKRGGGRIACFSLAYPERDRDGIDPALGRILRSLR